MQPFLTAFYVYYTRELFGDNRYIVPSLNYDNLFRLLRRIRASSSMVRSRSL